MTNEETTILYRPVGRKELDLIKETIEITSEFKRSQSQGTES
jgi:hypothetical protein